MKKLQHILKFAVTFVLVAVFAISTNAADITSLPVSGVWNGGKLAKDAVVKVTLEGDVDLKGPIIIPNKTKLIIRKKPGTNSSDKTLTYDRLYLSTDFTVPAGQIPCMFEVQPGGTLEIYGNDISAGDFIAIKGSTGGEPATPMTDGVFNESAVNEYYNNANYKNVGRYHPNLNSNHFLYDWGKKNGAADNGAMIYVAGSLVIKDAKIASALSTDEAAAIKVPIVRNNSTGTYGKLLLEDVEIRNCYSQSGSALIVYNQVDGDKGKNNTPESCSITLLNCKVYQNYCRSSIGGPIRTGGGVVGNLIIQNTSIYKNYVAGYGGALVAAAQGHENTLLIMDGCKIHDNKAATYAGGAMITGSFEFRNSITKIYKNSAATYGGGMYLIIYNGVDFTEAKTLNMTFGNKVEIYNNTAGDSGGGVCLNMRELTSLVANSTLNINFDGANIHDNTASQSGGGVMLTYDNSKINVNLNFKSGNITGNTATTKDGGGVYCQIGPISGESASPNVDVSKCRIKLNGGIISNNKAPAGSGGGVAVKNLPIYCDDDAAGIKVFSNEALNYGAGIYVDNANFSMNSGSVYSNECTSTVEGKGEGGGIYCANGSSFIITGGVVGGDAESDGNKSRNGAGIALADSKLIINQGVVASNVASNFGGGIHMKSSEFEMTDGSVYRNSSTKSNGEGGGIYALESTLKIDGGLIGGDNATYANKAFNGAGVFIQNCDLTMTNGRVSYNLSQRNAGGIYVKGTSTFSFEKGSICNNQNTDGVHDGHGAGIFVLNCNKFTIEDGEISGNHSANRGGGIYFSSAAKDVSISGGYIKDNHADSSQGGGIYVEGSNGVKVTGGVISGNNAVEGGGLFANGGTVTISGGEIVDNVADVHGGGLYLEDGTLNITNAVISSNKAPKTADINESGKGGGLYVLKSTARVNITGGMISSNVAERHGGGIYSSEGIVTIDGGHIVENTSTIGGGIYNYAATINMTGGNINNNVGRLGGGVCLGTSTASMTFSNGLITGNKAVYSSGNITTGYESSGLSGFGGGICLNKGSFVFQNATSVGLYNNIADKAGDDVYASGNNTTVTLPYVGSMDLSGYKTETSELYWVEDYVNGDTGYAQGTYMNKAQGYVPMRYRDAIANQNLVYPVPVSEGGQTFTNIYMALSLGHEIIYATLVRSGLLKGENAIYRVSRLDDNGTADKSDDRWTVYSELLLFGPEDALTAEQAANKSVSKRIALYSGTWKVEETNWAWTYDKEDAITHEITGSSSPAEKAFVFKGTKLKETDEGFVPPERYDESVVRNDFGSGTSETDKGAPASESGFEKITDNGVSW